MNSAAHASLLVLLLSSTAFAEELELTVARLAGCSWANHPGLESEEAVRPLGGFFLRFGSDMTFSAVVGPGQGGETAVVGRYTVADNRLSLSRMTEAGLVPWLVGGVLRYGTQAYRYPFYYIEFEAAFSSAGEKVFAPLPANDHVLLDLTTTLTRGRSIEIDGFAAVVVNAGGKTTDVLNTRLAPSALAERAFFETGEGSRSAIPKGADLQVLARTVAMEKIGALESHWYYVEYWPDPSGPIQAWVFGGYVSVD